MLHERTPSPDGLETNFAVNTLGSFALTLALQPALFRAGPARVVFVSSGGQVGWDWPAAAGGGWGGWVVGVGGLPDTVSVCSWGRAGRADAGQSQSII